MVSTASVDDVRILEFPQHGDSRGHLVAIEGAKDIPFEIRRVFYIYGSDGDVVRGQHANRKSDFVLINVCGTCKVRAVDAEGNERVFTLDRPNIGVYLPRMIWKDMYEFSPDCVMLVLSSEHYNSAEYIRSIEEFRN